MEHLLIWDNLAIAWALARSGRVRNGHHVLVGSSHSSGAKIKGGAWVFGLQGLRLGRVGEFANAGSFFFRLGVGTIHDAADVPVFPGAGVLAAVKEDSAAEGPKFRHGNICHRYHRGVARPFDR